MAKCNVHEFFFDRSCHLCKEEYDDLKGTNILKQEMQNSKGRDIDKEIGLKNYKEFTEERAKKLYEEIFLQYLKKGDMSEAESIERSKKIIRKQCLIRGIEPWSWI